MRIVKHYIERPKARVRKRSHNQEEEFRQFFWGMLGKVRNGEYKVNNFDSLVEEVEREQESGFKSF